jgi:hypothetical protein
VPQPHAPNRHRVHARLPVGGVVIGRLLGTAEPRLGGVAADGGRVADLHQQVSPERLQRDVEALTGPRSRLAAGDAIAHAERTIAAGFGSAGWEVSTRPFLFQDVVGLRDGAEHRPDDPHVSYERLAGVNVIARKPGTRAGGAILVGAHYDTVLGSPGADDDASGVAALLELARLLAPVRFEREVVLAAFDMEEIGCFGSRAFVTELAGRSGLAAAIILEAIAYTSQDPGSQSLPPGIGLLYPAQVARIRRRRHVGDWTLIVFRRSSIVLARAFAAALARLEGADAVVAVPDPVDLPVLGGLLRRVAPWVDEFARSDHVEFWKAGVPAIQITDTANFRNPNYHRRTDTVDTLDLRRLAAVVAATAITVEGLAGVTQERSTAEPGRPR